MWNELPKKTELSFGALHIWNKICKQAQMICFAREMTFIHEEHRVVAWQCLLE
jgi:hypothetical protein